MAHFIGQVLGNLVAIFLVGIAIAWLMRRFGNQLSFWNRMLTAIPAAFLVCQFLLFFGTEAGSGIGSDAHVVAFSKISVSSFLGTILLMLFAWVKRTRQSS